MTLIGFVSGNVFQFADKRCDGLAAWARSGFNKLSESWLTWRQNVGGGVLRYAGDEWSDQAAERNPRSREQRQDPSSLEWLPETPPPEATLYKLPLPRTFSDCLQYLYLQDQHGGVPRFDIARLTIEALTELDRQRCKSVAMNGIHGIGGGTQQSPVDRINGGIMIATVREWLASDRPKHVRDVYLVDLKGGFLDCVDYPLS